MSALLPDGNPTSKALGRDLSWNNVPGSCRKSRKELHKLCSIPNIITKMNLKD
jgi:hypothetical protein